jgi:hypothetical protein
LVLFLVRHSGPGVGPQPDRTLGLLTNREQWVRAPVPIAQQLTEFDGNRSASVGGGGFSYGNAQIATAAHATLQP